MIRFCHKRFFLSPYLPVDRCWYSKQSERVAEAGNLFEKPDPCKVQCDYVGQADPESNLRVFVHHIPPDETKLAKYYRLKLLEVEGWNQAFWTEHNRRFYKEKEEFIQKHQITKLKDENNDQSESSLGLSDDEMSVFYKRFLDQNHEMHVKYNLMWYKKNFELLIMAFTVEVERFMNKFKERNKEKL